MELRHLRYFLAVAEELHFGKAAIRLHIAQPPLSKQIRQLEDELGIQLFNRTRRSVELTEAGKVFQREAYNAMECLEKGVQKARLASRGEAGWLSVGFIGSSTYEVLPLVLREFRGKFPEVELILQEIQSSEQNQALRERRIHVSFARFPKPEQGLVFETVYRENLVVALPQSHHLNRKKSLRLSDIANEPFVLFPHQPSAHSDNTIQVFADAGLTPQIVQTVEEMHTALGLVAAGIGVTLVPSSMQKTQREAVVYLNLAKPETVLELKMGYREDEASPVLKRFIETVHSMRFLNLVR
jgi:DNA-binding transcriptional LysR family regulator